VSDNGHDVNYLDGALSTCASVSFGSLGDVFAAGCTSGQCQTPLSMPSASKSGWQIEVDNGCVYVFQSGSPYHLAPNGFFGFGG
jgi:hypothetical protein